MSLNTGLFPVYFLLLFCLHRTFFPSFNRYQTEQSQSYASVLVLLVFFLFFLDYFWLCFLQIFQSTEFVLFMFSYLGHQVNYRQCGIGNGITRMQIMTHWPFVCVSDGVLVHVMPVIFQAVAFLKVYCSSQNEKSVINDSPCCSRPVWLPDDFHHFSCFSSPIQLQWTWTEADQLAVNTNSPPLGKDCKWKKHLHFTWN